MKRIIGLLLVVLMLCTFTVPAFAEEVSGDGYLTLASIAAGRGDPESDVIALCRQALEAYQNETKTGDKWAAAAEMLLDLGMDESELTGIYEKAARAYLDEAKSAESTNLAYVMVLCESAYVLAEKSGNAELIAEITEASVSLCSLQNQDEAEKFRQTVMGLAQKWSPESLPHMLIMPVVCNFMPKTGAFDMAAGTIDSVKLGRLLAVYYEAAADYLFDNELYTYAFYLYISAFSYKYYDVFSGEKYPDITGDRIVGKFTACLEPAARQALAGGDPDTASYFYLMVGSMYAEGVKNSEQAKEYFTKGAEILLDAAAAALEQDDGEKAAEFYEKAADVYENDLLDENAAAEYRAEAAQLRMENDPGYASDAASVLSDGSVTIVLCVVCLAVGLCGGLLLGRRKKPAPAGGADDD